MKVWDIALYFAIGGAVLGVADRQLVEKCGRHFSDAMASQAIALWPGYLAAAVITKSTESKECSEED